MTTALLDYGVVILDDTGRCLVATALMTKDEADVAALKIQGTVVDAETLRVYKRQMLAPR